MLTPICYSKFSVDINKGSVGFAPPAQRRSSKGSPLKHSLDIMPNIRQEILQKIEND